MLAVAAATLLLLEMHFGGVDIASVTCSSNFVGCLKASVL